MNRKGIGQAIVAAGLLTMGLETSLFAQPPMLAPQIEEKPVVTPVRKLDGPIAQRLLELKNLPPNLMAWWLDPQFKAVPPAVSRGAKGKPSEGDVTAATRPEGDWTLPEGVLNVFGVKELNSIAVVGTAEGIRKLADKLPALDRPIRQVQIQTLAYRISVEDAKMLGIDFMPYEKAAGDESLVPQGLKIGAVLGDFQAAIAELKQQKKAKMINISSFSGIDRMPVYLASTQISPIAASSKEVTSLLFKDLDRDTIDKPQLYGVVANGFEMLSTFEKDGSISLSLTWSHDVGVHSSASSGQILALGSLEKAALKFKVRPGETVAMSGFPATLLAQSAVPGQSLAPVDATANVILFLTVK